MPPVMPSASTSSYGKSNGRIRDLRAAQLNGRALTLFGTLCSSSDALKTAKALGLTIRRIDEKTDQPGVWDELAQQFQPFCREWVDHKTNPRDIAARSVEAGN